MYQNNESKKKELTEYINKKLLKYYSDETTKTDLLQKFQSRLIDGDITEILEDLLEHSKT